MKLRSNSRAGRPARIGALSLLAVLVPVAAAQAQHRHRAPPPQGSQWHGDGRQSHQHDWPVWRSGHGFHGAHGGRVGWWWFVGPAWYFHPVPPYPYPNPYEPPAWAMPPAESPPPPPPAAYWYYCEGAKAYYPYVPTCPGGWKQVPATPIDATPAQPR